MLGKLLMLVRSKLLGELNYPISQALSLSPEGSFAAKRKFDIHTGIDLYCPEDEVVKAMAAGVVYRVVNFTGPSAGSPWWQETQAVIVEHDFGVVVYGEVAAKVSEGQVLKAGESLGTVKQVLTKDKGRPMTMLHLEWYSDLVEDGVVWLLTEPMPEKLLDPESLIKGI